MSKKVAVGLHLFDHDANITTYDFENKKFKYLKFERVSGIKNQACFDCLEWIPYLEHLGYRAEDVNYIFLASIGDILNYNYSNLSKQFVNLRFRPTLVDHHYCHHISTFGKNSLVIDGNGSQEEYITVFKNNEQVQKIYCDSNDTPFGIELQKLWLRFGFVSPEETRHKKFPPDFSGHTMALSAFGKDFSDQLIEGRGMYFKYMQQSSKQENWQNDYITSLHHYWFKKFTKILKKHFDFEDEIYISGGVGHNIITNTYLKKLFKNIKPTPHCGDEGISIGALIFGLEKVVSVYDYELDFNKLYQNDENLGFASQNTISKTAKYLQEGKIVLWCQGFGELGPRALGNRSILYDPAKINAKEILNDKVKKRIWFRPYGASVTVDSYKEYFDIDYESPYMLFQANVKDPKKFRSITHHDGTCRIQTVDKSKPYFYSLLKEFEKLSGYPLLINTSCNVPGKPIVGTKEHALSMFNTSNADILVVGNEIHEK
jgi:carbamoyltransferase